MKSPPQIRILKLHSWFLIQYAFERYPAQVFRIISGQCRQLFDCQIVIDSDGVPRMDHSAVPKTYAAMSPVDRTVSASALIMYIPLLPPVLHTKIIPLTIAQRSPDN